MRGLLIGIGIAVAIWLLAVVVLIALGRRAQARELATLILNLLVLFRGLLRDPRVPRSAKVWLVLGVVWIASPIDLIPEFIPIAGPLTMRSWRRSRYVTYSNGPLGACCLSTGAATRPCWRRSCVRGRLVDPTTRLPARGWGRPSSALRSARPWGEIVESCPLIVQDLLDRSQVDVIRL